MTVTIQQEKVTPKKAQEWLEKNTNNRPMRVELVDRLTRDMQAGNWQNTADTVKFNTKGDLIDGQHRLVACMKSGKTVTMHVARGVATEAQTVIDTGVSRSAKDALILSGQDFRNVHIVAAVARLMVTEPRLGYTDVKRKTASTSEIMDFVIENRENIQAASDMGAKYYKDIALMPSVIGAFWMAVSRTDADAAYEFLSSIAERRTSGAGDARLALSKRLADLQRERARLSQQAYLSLILRAWNAWRKGTFVQKLPVYNPQGAVLEIPETFA